MENQMKKIILFLWQLPQNILGLFLVFTTRSKYANGCWRTKKSFTGISLGNFVILRMDDESDISLKHETGHQKQSLILGPNYLLIIGLPSLLGNIWDRIFHKKWNNLKREKWYYSQPWEKWADKLGKVKRF